MVPRAFPDGKTTLFWFTLLVALAACSVTPPRQPAEKPLVSDEAPIFDRSFRDIEFGDLELADFWIEAEPATANEEVPLHHRTVVELVDRTHDGVVNISSDRSSIQHVGLYPGSSGQYGGRPGGDQETGV
jgi:hypothetical protein